MEGKCIKDNLKDGVIALTYFFSVDCFVPLCGV